MCPGKRSNIAKKYKNIVSYAFIAIFDAADMHAEVRFP
jgi:hypothetical protein